MNSHASTFINCAPFVLSLPFCLSLYKYLHINFLYLLIVLQIPCAFTLKQFSVYFLRIRTFSYITTVQNQEIQYLVHSQWLDFTSYPTITLDSYPILRFILGSHITFPFHIFLVSFLLEKYLELYLTFIFHDLTIFF